MQEKGAMMSILKSSTYFYILGCYTAICLHKSGCLLKFLLVWKPFYAKMWTNRFKNVIKFKYYLQWCNRKEKNENKEQINCLAAVGSKPMAPQETQIWNIL